MTLLQKSAEITKNVNKRSLRKVFQKKIVNFAN